MTIDRKQHPVFNKIEHIKFPKPEKYVLDNNIPVYKINGGTQEVVKVDVMISAGAIHSNKRLVAPITGLMLNEGTQNKSAHTIAETFDFYGAYFQPNVEKDRADVGLVSTSKHFKEVLPLFNEVLCHSSFPQGELDLLLERRRQKFLVEREKTAFMARELFNQRVFGSHPYGFYSSESEYSNITQAELIEFYKKNYNPGNFEIIISGRVTDNEINLLNKYIGKAVVTKPPEPNLLNVQNVTNFDPIFWPKSDAVQSSVRLGMQTINMLHPDYLGLKVLITILGGYFGSRLMKNIREDKGYTYGVHAMLVSLLHSGYFGVAADVKTEHTNETIIEIKKEMENLCKKAVPEKELAIVKSYMMGDMLHMFDGPFATSDSFKNILPYNLGFDHYENMKQTILNITSGQLLELANRYFDTQRLVVVVAGKMQ